MFRPIRAFGKPAIDFAGPIPFPALQSLFDALLSAGLQWYWKADFFNELKDPAIDLHAKYAERLPSMQSTMHLYPINGAAHRPQKGDTAWSFRDANFAEVIVGVDPDPANNAKHHPVGEGLLAGPSPVRRRGRLPQHDDGRGRRRREVLLSRQLQAPRGGEGEVRSAKPLPAQPEHQARAG